jgi:hypothetical protein
VTTVALVGLLGRFEEPVPAATLRSPALPLVEVLVTTVLLGVLADRGLGQAGQDTPTWLLVWLAFVALAVFDRLLRRPAPGRRASPRPMARTGDH